MKGYIDLNTEMRRKAKSDVETRFYKGMNVQVFGKTMKNIRNRSEIILLREEKKKQKKLLKVQATEHFVHK